MQGALTTSKNTGRGKLVFMLNLCAALFFVLGNYINIYRVAFAGATFELLWFPMMLLICLCPVISIAFWIKEKFSFRSFYFYAILVTVLAALLLLLHKTSQS